MRTYQVLFLGSVLLWAGALGGCSADRCGSKEDEAMAQAMDESGGAGSERDDADREDDEDDDEVSDEAMAVDSEPEPDDEDEKEPAAEESEMDAGAEEPTADVEADYGELENWLCHADYKGACDVNLDTTVIEADGSLSVETFEPHPNPPIDCFYVYPTVSLDETPNSDLVPGPEENNVVRAQFARLASQCRLFAPMYRQVTLTALRANLAGAEIMPDRELAFQDVRAAFKHYLDHDNNGRGFVLVGHSQGSGVLTRLIQQELDKTPADPRLLAAMLLGTNITVPSDAVAGGSFEHLPLCQAADELGCIVTYASFRADSPPSASALFARSSDPDLVAACTHPGALGGGPAPLHAYLSTGGPGASSQPMGDWLADGTAVETPFVSVPGLLNAECTMGMTGSYLAITVNGDPNDPRTDEITGDVFSNGQVLAEWGLHLIDVHLAMGNLIDLVQTKAAAFAQPPTP